ncbi:MAG: polymer-forming cytoskeletal protein [Candidatus Methylomirabilales bacterium]
MALWKEYRQKEHLPVETDQLESPDEASAPLRAVKESPQKTEFVIAPGLTVEGKIQGTGHVRIAGQFKGDIHVDGDLTLESGCHVTGDLQAKSIRVGGEVQGNIHASSRVELLQSGTLIGDLKAGALAVTAGSRMRGLVEFGWDEREPTQLSTSDDGETAG